MTTANALWCPDQLTRCRCAGVAQNGQRCGGCNGDTDENRLRKHRTAENPLGECDMQPKKYWTKCARCIKYQTKMEKSGATSNQIPMTLDEIQDGWQPPPVPFDVFIEDPPPSPPPTRGPTPEVALTNQQLATLHAVAPANPKPPPPLPPGLPPTHLQLAALNELFNKYAITSTDQLYAILEHLADPFQAHLLESLCKDMKEMKDEIGKKFGLVVDAVYDPWSSLHDKLNTITKDLNTITKDQKDCAKKNHKALNDLDESMAELDEQVRELGIKYEALKTEVHKDKYGSLVQETVHALMQAHDKTEKEIKQKNDNVNFMMVDELMTITRLGNEKYHTLIAKVENQNEKYETLIAKVENQNEKYDTLIAKVQNQNEKYDTLIAKVENQNEKYNTLIEKVENHNEKYDTLTEKVEEVEKQEVLLLAQNTQMYEALMLELQRGNNEMYYEKYNEKLLALNNEKYPMLQLQFDTLIEHMLALVETLNGNDEKIDWLLALLKEAVQKERLGALCEVVGLKATPKQSASPAQPTSSQLKQPA